MKTMQKHAYLILGLLLVLFFVAEITFAQSGQRLGSRQAADPMVYAKELCTYTTTEIKNVDALEMHQFVSQQFNLVYDLGKDIKLTSINLKGIAETFKDAEEITFYYKTGDSGIVDNMLKNNNWTKLNVNSEKQANNLSARSLRVDVKIKIKKMDTAPSVLPVCTETVNVEKNGFKIQNVKKSEAQKKGWEILTEEEGKKYNDGKAHPIEPIN